MFADQRAVGRGWRDTLATLRRRSPLAFWGGCAVLLIGALGLLVAGYLGWAIAVCAVVFLALLAPAALLVLLPPAVAFGSLFPLALGSLSAGPTDVLVAGLILAGVWEVARQRGRLEALTSSPPNVRRTALGSVRAIAARQPVLAALLGAVALYLVVILLSAGVATSKVDVAKEALKWGEVLVVVAATWYFVRRDGRALARVLWSAVAAGLAEALLGYAQWALGAGDLGPGGDAIRVFGTFGQPNPYAADLNLALLPALAGVLFGADARARWVLGAAAVLIFGAQVFADSRGALLALVAAVIVLLVLGLRVARQAALAALVGIPLLAVAWLVHLIPARLQDRLLAQVRLSDVSLHGQVNDANYSTVERLAHWVAGLRMFAAHPLLGVGAGNYNAAYARYRLPDWPEPLGHAHNYYINAAAETGILGLLAFLTIAAAALFAAWHAARATRSAGQSADSENQALSPVGADARAREHEESGESRTERPQSAAESGERGPLLLLVGPRAWALGCAAVVVAILVHSFVDDLFVHAMELEFALMLGILAVFAGEARVRLSRVNSHSRPAAHEPTSRAERASSSD